MHSSFGALLPPQEIKEIQAHDNNKENLDIDKYSAKIGKAHFEPPFRYLSTANIMTLRKSFYYDQESVP